MIKNNDKGYSILEMLVAVGILAIVGIMVTNSVASSFKSSKKSSAISGVKNDVDYAMSTMERLLRNATSIDACTNYKLTYTDEYGNSVYFECLPNNNSQGYVASASAGVAITSTSTNIDCSATPIFNCPVPAVGVPQMIEINLKGVDKNLGTGIEGASVTSKTRVLLRNYTD